MFGGLEFALLDATPTLEDAEQALQRLLDARGWHEFADLCAQWRTTLTALGDAFAAGIATVDPVARHKTCEHCDLVPLCRILERGPAPEIEAGDDDA